MRCGPSATGSAGRRWIRARGTVALWDLSAAGVLARPAAVLGEHGGRVTSLETTVFGRRILVVSGSDDRTARRWTVDIGRTKATVRPGSNGSIGDGDLRGGAAVSAVANAPPRAAGPRAARPLSVVAADGMVHVWGAAGATLAVPIGERVTALAIAGDTALIGTDRALAAVRPHPAGLLTRWPFDG